MELETSTWMMIFFIIAFVVSIWKVYAFLPTKELADDDTTAEAQKHLTDVMIGTINKYGADLSIDELYVYMIEAKEFDNERHWRFNNNKLRQLLNVYYVKNPHLCSIADIYKETNR